MSIRTHLEGRYSDKTAAIYNKYWEVFLSYLEGLGMELENINHALILEYIQSLQQLGQKTDSVNTVLGGVGTIF